LRCYQSLFDADLPMKIPEWRKGWDLPIGSIFLRSTLRSRKILLQNCAIRRNGALTTLPLVSLEKRAAQHPEKLRKKPSLNTESSDEMLTAFLEVERAIHQFAMSLIS